MSRGMWERQSGVDTPSTFPFVCFTVHSYKSWETQERGQKGTSSVRQDSFALCGRHQRQRAFIKQLATLMGIVEKEIASAAALPLPFSHLYREVIVQQASISSVNGPICFLSAFICRIFLHAWAELFSHIA
eukprot:2611977-Amphidinium_carterae.2